MSRLEEETVTSDEVHLQYRVFPLAEEVTAAVFAIALLPLALAVPSPLLRLAPFGLVLLWIALRGTQQAVTLTPHRISVQTRVGWWQWDPHEMLVEDIEAVEGASFGPVLWLVLRDHQGREVTMGGVRFSAELQHIARLIQQVRESRPPPTDEDRQAAGKVIALSTARAKQKR